MTEIERLTLMAAFLAALVAAGLSLSYVPHVELVTLVTFASGIVLGSLRGALVGATGMVLYVLSNSALKGFPPSPLPILAAQAAAASLAGLAGGWWRRFWLAGGSPRGWGFRILPVVGLILAAISQAILNFAYAMFLSPGGKARSAVFVAGMAAGVVDMVVNGALFAVAGPRMASVLRRMARTRGWWGRGALVGTLLLVVPGPGQAMGTGQPADSLDVRGAGTVDSVQVEHAGPGVAEKAPGKPAELPGSSGTIPASLRPLRITEGPLWRTLDLSEVPVFGLPAVGSGGFWPGSERSLTSVPAMAPVMDRWGLGWGRSRTVYDGLPMSGPVHGFGEPPDLPLAWRGSWRERWTATGTSLGLTAPPVPGLHPASQISLTTGSLGRRTAEFALFRNLGSVNLGTDFADRQEQGLTVLRQADGDRVWVRVKSVPGKRPDWSLDVSTGSQEHKLVSGVEVERAVRRVQGSLRGPFLGGETRLALQLRRQALQVRRMAIPFDELLFDGFTAQAEWAGPADGVVTRLRWDRDRRRGILDEGRTFDGFRGELDWAGRERSWAWEVTASAGHQQPYGFTYDAAAIVAVDRDAWAMRASVSHEEELPGLVLDLDRAVPEYGLPEWLDRQEHAENPEERTGLRLEGIWRSQPLRIRLGAWATRIHNYRADANPLWLPGVSPFGMTALPSVDTDVVGLYGEGRVNMGGGWYAEGNGRLQSRDDRDVPFLAPWNAEGGLHWRRWWFSRSLDLDAAVGGRLVGPRRAPAGARYPTESLGFVRLVGHVDNGIVSMSFENLLDSYAESDLRADDTVTPVPVAGRTFLLGLTLYLSD